MHDSYTRERNRIAYISLYNDIYGWFHQTTCQRVIAFFLSLILPFASGFYDVGVPNTYLYIYSFALGLAAVLVTTTMGGVHHHDEIIGV